MMRPAIRLFVPLLYVFLLTQSASATGFFRNFNPADELGPYAIGYQRVSLVDASRDGSLLFPTGRVLETHIWYPVDQIDTVGAISLVYDSGYASLANFTGFPVPHIVTRSPHGALVDAASKLPPSADVPGACTNNLPEPCGSSEIVGLPASHDGPFPLLMFSHGANSGPRFYVDLAEYLASHGYVVVAPAHAGDRAVDLITADVLGASCSALRIRPCLDDFKKVLSDRPADISFVLDQVLLGNAGIDPDAIDADRIGMFGHSLGGYTTLVVTGGNGLHATDGRIKAMAPLSPFAGPDLFAEDEGLAPVVDEIDVPSMVSYGTLDKTFGINFLIEGRYIFSALQTALTYRKYRVEIQRGVHQGFSNICAGFDGILEVIQKGNENTNFDYGYLAAILTSDRGIPPLPPEFTGKAAAGPQALCERDLFFGPANKAVWDAVPLTPSMPLSELFFPENGWTQGYIDNLTLQFVRSLRSVEHLRAANTYLTAFFNRELRRDRGDWLYGFYLSPFYARYRERNVKIESCQLWWWRKQEHCVSNIN